LQKGVTGAGEGLSRKKVRLKKLKEMTLHGGMKKFKQTSGHNGNAKSRVAALWQNDRAEM